MNTAGKLRRGVLVLAIGVFLVGWVAVLPPAAAKGGFVAYNAATHTYTISPTGSDDTANIQAALNACTDARPRCTLQLDAGTYYTSQLTVYGFQGRFVGMGQGATVIQALPNLPSPAAEYNTESNPFWAGLPGPSNPWPAMLTFVDGSILVSGMTFYDPYAVPGPSWAFPGVAAIDALAGGILIVGQHADASVNHVTVRGVAGPAAQDLFGYNIINAIFPEGFLLPAVWTDPLTDALPLTGTFSVTNDAFYSVAAGPQFENLVNARVIACSNSFDDVAIPLAVIDVSNTPAYLCSNQGVDVSQLMGILAQQGVYKSNLKPSTVYITGNDFQVTRGAAGFILQDFEAEPTLGAVVTENAIFVDSSSAGGIVSMGLKSIVLAENEIRGNGPIGVQLVSGPGIVARNEIRGSVDGVVLDNTLGVVVLGNEVQNSGQYGIAVTDGASNSMALRNVITNSGVDDLYWDQTGTGNVWVGDSCQTSEPPGLCSSH